jgi:hypothetical protein
MIFFLTLLLGLIVGGLASWLRISPWWLLLLAAGAAGIAAVLLLDLEGCQWSVVGDWFAGAILFGIGLCVATAFGSICDAVRLANAHATDAALGRAAPFLFSVVVGIGTVMLFVASIGPCLD